MNEYHNNFDADSEGNVPLWDAILGQHEAVIKVLSENGATLSSGDVGQFSCSAAEQNNTDLLQKIISFGGDVTLPSHGTTALHKAVAQDNVQICKFLIENGADSDKPDDDGWTPRALAVHQRKEEIKTLLESKLKSKEQERQEGGTSASPQPPTAGSDSDDTRMRARTKHSHMRSSLAGIITAGQRQNECEFILGHHLQNITNST